MEFFATCPTGFEHLLADELAELGIAQPRPLQGQVSFFGELEGAYRACLWSRLASRVILVLQRHDARTSDELYEGALQVPWEEHLPHGATFCIDATGTNEQLRTTQFISLRVKDAIVDRLQARTEERAQTDTQNPDVRVVTRISRNRVVLGIDLAGDPLFYRAYGRMRPTGGLRFDYAAALLRAGGWSELLRAEVNGFTSPTLVTEDPTLSAEGPTLLAVSPSPDSLVLEAALMAANHAPGLLRTSWGFRGWAGHDEACWQELTQEAREAVRAQTNAQVVSLSWEVSVQQARRVLGTMGVAANLRVLAESELRSELPELEHVSLLAADLSNLKEHELVREAALLTSLSNAVRTCSPTHVSVASRDQLPSTYLQQEPSHTLKSMLGRDELLLLSYRNLGEQKERTVVELPDGTSVPVLVPASNQFVARLRKNMRLLGKWAQREDITCYRLYDADLPDYAVSLEVFQGTNPATGEPTNRKWLQIFEYAAPKDIDPLLARSRLMDVLCLAPRILGIRERDTFVRVRRRDKGGSQYASEAAKVSAKPVRKGHVPLPPGAHLIDEGGLTFEVNFSTRMDCGIFLDHRDTRAMLREMAKQTKGSKRFLNLFAYTGTATCYAADGGMRYTTTVDLSRPSLDWARRNMLRNGFDGAEHEYVQADVVRWISEQRRTKNRWDLVFCDVPTFSNSNRMGRRSFDVQRDHAELLIGVSRLLVRGGACVFSCNLRSFKPDVDALRKAGVEIEDVTDKTIPHDFERNKRIHHAYLVRRTG